MHAGIADAVRLPGAGRSQIRELGNVLIRIAGTILDFLRWSEPRSYSVPHPNTRAGLLDDVGRRKLQSSPVHSKILAVRT